MSNNKKTITIFEMNRLRIRPVLNQVLKKENFSPNSDNQQKIISEILTRLANEEIMELSDNVIRYHIYQVMDTIPVIKLLGLKEKIFSKKRSNYDIRHKETIRLFLREYFELFFPELATKMNFKTVQFLDKELITLLGDSGQQRIADALIMINVSLNNTNEWILIHWEAQGMKNLEYNERMFHLFCGIYYQYRKRVLPIAMFIDPHQWRKPVSDSYSMKILNYTVVQNFSYQLIKLKQYDAEEFANVAPKNPLTWGYLPLTNFQKKNRPLIKAKAVNGILKTSINEKQKATLYSLIDTSLKLTNEEDRQYLDLIEQNNEYKEAKMYETIEEYLMEKAEKKGIEKGRQEGQSILLSQILKSGMMTVDQIVQITGAQYDYIQNIAEKVNKESVNYESLNI